MARYVIRDGERVLVEKSTVFEGRGGPKPAAAKPAAAKSASKPEPPAPAKPAGKKEQ